MDRKGFLKMMGVGAIGSALIPTVLKAETRKDNTTAPSVAVDVESLTNLTVGGEKLSPAEVIRIWRETGILIYNSHYGNAPIVLGENIIEVVDF